MRDRRLTRALRGAAAPDLLLLEVGQALMKYVRAGVLDLPSAAALFGDALELPLELYPANALAAPAFEAAARLDISVYDASYLVLAEHLDVPLVTADRRLASVATRSVLLE